MQNKRPVIYWVLSAGLVVFLVSLIVVAPVAAATGHTEVAAGIYHAFSPFCHQRADRSFFIAGYQFAVCARCTGVYAGFALTLLLYPFIRSLKSTIMPPRIVLVLAALPLAIDFSVTFFGFWENTHTSRLLTGALLGSVTVFYVMPGIIELSLRNSRTTRAKPMFTLASPEAIASAPSDYSAPDRRI